MNTKRGLLFFIAVLLITLSACGSQNEVVKETEKFVKNTENILLEAYNAGVNISFVSGYNTMGVPVYDDAVLNGDGVIETALTSNGATVAKYGETLSDNQLAAADSRYVSPDKVVDASTAFFRFAP